MNNIEEGCLAVVINTINDDNMIVTVGKFLNDVPSVVHLKIWEIDKEITYCNVLTNIITKRKCGPEKCLLRIDDGQLSEEDIEQHELVHSGKPNI